MATSGPNRTSFSTNGIIGLVILGVVLFVLFNIVGWIFSILYEFGWIAWVAAAVIDYTVVLGYFRTIGNLIQRNWIVGLVAAVASVALYPFVGIFLIGKGLFRKELEKRFPQFKEARNRRKADETFTDFEEVPRTAPEEDFLDFEELPPARDAEPLPRREKEDTGYDELFK